MTAAAADLFRQGVTLHQKQQLALAEQLYRQVLQIEPLHADCLHNLGALLIQQQGSKQGQEALQLIKAAIQLAPGNARYRHSLGVVHEASQQWSSAADAFERAVEKCPNDVKSRMHLARALKSAGQLSRASEVYMAVLRLQPDHKTAHYKLGSVLRQLGKHEAAAEAYRKHLQSDPNHVQAAFWLASLTPGSQVPTCPPEVVAQLFDGYSDHFDDHLVNKLSYKTPQQLMDSILEYLSCHQPSSKAATQLMLPPHQQQQQQQQQCTEHTWSHAVDLGCGTGLMGPLLRPHTQHLSGVDLSAGMVQKARERGCYDELAVDELVHFLQTARHTHAQGPLQYNLLVAADVFVYIGDLAPVLKAAAEVSSPRALFAFSTELLKPSRNLQPVDSCSSSVAKPETDGGMHIGEDTSQPYVLQTTGRYAHSQTYLKTVAGQCGWQVVLMKDAQLRQNAGQPIWGSLCLIMRHSS